MDSPPSGPRIGLLGGSFDPIHGGHLAMARAARDRLGLARVELMVAARSPLKTGTVASASDRLAMARLACEGEDRIVASDLELRRGGPSYTIDTVRELRRANPGSRVFLVLGSDSLTTFPRWREAAALLEEATPVIVPRSGFGKELLEEARRSLGNAGGELLTRGWIALPPVDVSATEVRARLAAGRSIDGLVPKKVAEYIAARGLYRR